MNTTIVVAAAAILTVGIASWRVSRAEPSHVDTAESSLSLEVRTSSFFLLDLRADGVREVTSFQDPFEPSRGDQTIFQDQLFRHGDPVGFSGGTCTVTAVQPTDVDPLKLTCQASYELPEGQIATQGLTTNNPVKRMAITGGTGRYVGASGEVTFTENGDGTASVVFRFIRPRR